DAGADQGIESLVHRGQADVRDDLPDRKINFLRRRVRVDRAEVFVDGFALAGEAAPGLVERVPQVPGGVVDAWGICDGRNHNGGPGRFHQQVGIRLLLNLLTVSNLVKHAREIRVSRRRTRQPGNGRATCGWTCTYRRSPSRPAHAAPSQ